MLGVSRCTMRHLQPLFAGSTVCFGHNHRQPRTEIFNSRRRSNEGIKRGAIWDFMTGKSPWGNPQIPILLLNGQGEKTPFVESLPPCFSTEPDYPSRHRSADGENPLTGSKTKTDPSSGVLPSRQRICGSYIPRALPPVTHGSAFQAPECLWVLVM